MGGSASEMGLKGFSIADGNWYDRNSATILSALSVEANAFDKKMSRAFLTGADCMERGETSE
jgi:hypothetical protein